MFLDFYESCMLIQLYSLNSILDDDKIENDVWSIDITSTQ